MTEYILKRSHRKTLCLRITPEGVVEVRAPVICSKSEIDRFVKMHESWIEKAQKRQLTRAEKYPEPSEEEKKMLIKKAKEKLPLLVEYYSHIMGVYPATITITSAKTRFGSCSGNNRLSFSWRLMRYPEKAIEAVVVHELAHIKHHDHSKYFYDFVLSVLPDYREREKLLKQ